MEFSTKTLSDDGANAKLMHFDHMHWVRYLEIFVVGGDPSKGQLSANVYNTSTVPGFDGKTTKDSTPQAWVERINVGEIKQRFNALQANLNGPKLWMMDWADVPIGAEHEFNGRKATWVGTLHLTPAAAQAMAKEGATQAYVPGTIERKTKLGYQKGTLVFLIDDDAGNTWVMKSLQIGMKPQYTYEEFAANAAERFKKLPPGWKFRTKVLDKELIMLPESGVAAIMPDEFFNVYDKTGPGYSNYKP